MDYLFSQLFYWPILVALVTGLLTGWISCGRAED